MMSVPSVVTVQKMLHLRGTIAEAISTKPQSVFAISPYFSVFSRKKLQEEGKGKSLFPRISPYFPMFSPTSCVRIYCNARMIVRQDANGKFNCVPEPRYISEYLPDVRRRKR
ncbi:AFH_G0022800.mRNA.1.CDS.1 [Saccharomyces cerevisiae]|nr:AFH_G0022800.mRNA.1.CDS.1 [Saccharomyces cerevisiae]CAI6721670.1 AFH_G0022800.mRNA.1.CDS.1 [Saccharomyces cerevisiae]